MIVEHSGQLLAKVPKSLFDYLNSRVTPSDAAFHLAPYPLFPASNSAGLNTLGSSSSSSDWTVITPTLEPTKHPWDIAHEHARGLARGSTVLAANRDVYIEPDLLHPGPARPPVRVAPTKGPDPNYPPPAKASFSPAWHLNFANFPAAWKISTGSGVRIAHLDTGYWPEHVSTPKRILPSEGFNFYEKNNNVVDPGTSGLLYNPGHGTATLALLAGAEVQLTFGKKTYTGPIGGAFDSDVVPVRIGPSVVHLYTQPLAQGLDYACSPRKNAPCQIVSLSHGGLPTSAWAAAVNRCYDAGVLIVAASGDNFYGVIGNIPTHFTVYPSAFNRVVTATGATYKELPYKTKVPFEMQGCWGPKSVMAKAVAAFTPNVPWMTWHTLNDWDLTGAGTSASTPQIAAACALWLSLYGKQYGVPWQRVWACREALLNSVAKAGANPREIGRGLLDASAMLDRTLADKIYDAVQQGKARPAPKDEVSFPFWRVLFGFGPPRSGIDQMYETEAAQLLARSQNPDVLSPVYKDPAGKALKASSKKAKSWRKAFIDEPAISKTLRDHLIKSIHV